MELIYILYFYIILLIFLHLLEKSKVRRIQGNWSSPDNDKASSGTSVWKETDFQVPEKGDSSE